jgi:hypothetical protein
MSKKKKERVFFFFFDAFNKMRLFVWGVIEPKLKGNIKIDIYLIQKVGIYKQK